MLKRILACSFILAVLPLLTSSFHNSTHSAPYAMTAFARRVSSGGGETCQCGCAKCICDPGETQSPCIQASRPGSPDADGAAGRVAAPTHKRGRSGLDYGSSALMLVMALWLWARLRA